MEVTKQVLASACDISLESSMTRLVVSVLTRTAFQWCSSAPKPTMDYDHLLVYHPTAELQQDALYLSVQIAESHGNSHDNILQNQLGCSSTKNRR